MSIGTHIGQALICGLLAGTAGAQEDGTLDLSPPDLSLSRDERAFRTCPEREARPAWAESLDGWEVERGLLLSAIQQARTYQAIIRTGDCSCAVKAPPWDAADAEYREGFAALDLQAVREARRGFDAIARGLRGEVRRVCLAQGNW